MFDLTPHKLAKKISKHIIHFNPEFRRLQDNIRYGLEWMLATVNQVFIVIIISRIFRLFSTSFNCFSQWWII
ncbi:hypothetical protein P5408_004010 [Bacillus subtilis]|nr:hypothetical protein [Bacillus subtilis]